MVLDPRKYLCKYFIGLVVMRVPMRVGQQITVSKNVRTLLVLFLLVVLSSPFVFVDLVCELVVCSRIGNASFMHTFRQ